MSVQIQLRRDTAANWTTADPTLASGEIGLETDTQKIKVGNGSTAWTSLAYYSWLPSQSGQSGKFLTTNGTALSWDIPSGGGGGGLYMQNDLIGKAFDLASADGTFYYCLATPQADGNITKLNCWVATNTYGSSATIELGIYNYAKSKLASGTVSVASTSVGIKTVTLGTPLAVTAGTPYYLALLNRSNTGDTLKFGTGSNNSNNTLIGGILPAQSVMPSTITSPSVASRIYWVSAL